MIPSKISFTGFDIDDPTRVLAAQKQNRPAFWPLDWTILPEPHTENNGMGLGEVNFYAWFRKNCCHQWEIGSDMLGRRIFAFEDDGEATLFLLSF